MIKIRHNTGNILTFVVSSIVLSSLLTVGVWQYARSIYQPTITSLNAQIGSLQSEVQALIERKQELENQTKALKEQISDLETEFNTSSVIIELLEESIDDLAYEAAQYREEIAAKKKRALPPLQLSDVNIVTAEPDGDGRLRVWGYTGSGYENIWSVELVDYYCAAIGDADNDGKREIVAVTRSMNREKGKTSYDIFFDVYKEGESGVWTRSEAVIEDRTWWANEITITDVDGLPGNEVVMKTPHWLAIYKFSEGTFKIESSSNSFVGGPMTYLQSVAVGDVDADGLNEIIASARVVGPGAGNEGYLCIFQDITLEDPSIMPIDASMGGKTLRVGNLDDDEYLEICSTGYRSIGSELYQAYIFIWKYMSGEWQLIEQPIFGPTTPEPWMHLDVGELNADLPGEEIVLGTGPDPDQLILYYLAQDAESYHLEKGWEKTLDYYSVVINYVFVADSDGDGNNEVVVCGGGGETEYRHGQEGRFYLEVFDVSGEGLSSKWSRLGGERGEYSVWYAAVG